MRASTPEDLTDWRASWFCEVLDPEIVRGEVQRRRRRELAEQRTRWGELRCWFSAVCALRPDPETLTDAAATFFYDRKVGRRQAEESRADLAELAESEGRLACWRYAMSRCRGVWGMVDASLRSASYTAAGLLLGAVFFLVAAIRPAPPVGVLLLLLLVPYGLWLGVRTAEVMAVQITGWTLWLYHEFFGRGARASSASWWAEQQGVLRRVSLGALVLYMVLSGPVFVIAFWLTRTWGWVRRWRSVKRYRW